MVRCDYNCDIPVVHDTAILCGKVVVEENDLIVPYAVIRADEVNAVGDMEPNVPVTPDQDGFSESVAQADHELVKGYKRIWNAC